MNAPINWPSGISAGADSLPVQQLFAILGHDATGDLIEALLDAMDAADGDVDCEGTIGNGKTEDDEPDVDAGDWSWPESHGRGLIARVEPLARHEDSEEDDEAEQDGEDCCGAGDDDVPGHTIARRFPDAGAGDPEDAECGGDRSAESEHHGFGDTAGADPRHRDRIRRTRCLPRWPQYHLGHAANSTSRKPDGWQLKSEPVVSPRIKRLKRRAPVATNVVAFRRGR